MNCNKIGNTAITSSILCFTLFYGLCQGWYVLLLFLLFLPSAVEPRLFFNLMILDGDRDDLELSAHTRHVLLETRYAQICVGNCYLTSFFSLFVFRVCFLIFIGHKKGSLWFRFPWMILSHSRQCFFLIGEMNSMDLGRHIVPPYYCILYRYWRAAFVHPMIL